MGGDGEAGLGDLGVAKVIAPVVEVLHLDTTARLHLRHPFSSARTGIAQKGFVVGDLAMLTLATLLHPPQIRSTRRLPNATVFVLIVDFVGPLYQIGVHISQCPASLFFPLNGS